MAPRSSRGRRRERRRLTHLVTAAAVVLLAAFGATAASLSDLKPKPPPAPATALLFGPDAPSAAPAVFKIGVQVAVSTQGRLFVGPLRSTDQAISVSMKPTDTTDLARQEDVASKIAIVRQRFEAVTAGTQSGATVDALRDLGRHLAGLPSGTVNVVLVGNLLKVTSEVDLTDPIQRGDVDASLAKVRASGLLSDCRGWRVHVVAGTADAGTVTDNRRDLHAREFWRRLVNQCGGQLVHWDTARLTSFPSPTAVPAVTLAPPGRLYFTLPRGALFARGDWELQPEAVVTLERLQATIAAHPHTRVAIDVYTADNNDSPPDLYLRSQRRTEAVARWLMAHGIAAARITAVGHGPQQPVAPNDTEAGQTLNSRIEVRLEPSGASQAPVAEEGEREREGP